MLSLRTGGAAPVEVECSLQNEVVFPPIRIDKVFAGSSRGLDETRKGALQPTTRFAQGGGTFSLQSGGVFPPIQYYPVLACIRAVLELIHVL